MKQRDADVSKQSRRHMSRDVEHLTPVKDKPLLQSEPKSVAAGIPAVLSTMAHGLTRMGAIRSVTNLTRVNSFGGFDCPGCAWPDPDDERTVFEFCENGAKAVADEATRARADPDFWSEWSVAELSRKSDHWLNSQGRLTHPMILRPDSQHYEPIAWQSAFEIIADHLSSLDNPDEAIFYTSGRTSNEAAFLWQLLARRLGTNNLPDCSNMCHESSGVALGDSIGIGKGTVKLDDFNKADLILVVGQNPGSNHPRMLSALKAAKVAGASVVSVNPLFQIINAHPFFVIVRCISKILVYLDTTFIALWIRRPIVNSWQNLIMIFVLIGVWRIFWTNHLLVNLLAWPDTDYFMRCSLANCLRYINNCH